MQEASTYCSKAGIRKHLIWKQDSKSFKATRGQGIRAAGGRKPATDMDREDTQGRDVPVTQEKEQGGGYAQRDRI